MAKDIPKKKRELIFIKYDSKCAYCGKPILFNNFHVDHIEPLFRKWTKEDLLTYDRIKGTSHIDNLNPACPSCNISKSTFTVEEWRNQIELKIDRLRKESTNFRILESFGLVKVKKSKIVFHFEKYTKKESEVING